LLFYLASVAGTDIRPLRLSGLRPAGSRPCLSFASEPCPINNGRQLQQQPYEYILFLYLRLCELTCPTAELLASATARRAEWPGA